MSEHFGYNTEDYYRDQSEDFENTIACLHKPKDKPKRKPRRSRAQILADQLSQATTSILDSSPEKPCASLAVVKESLLPAEQEIGELVWTQRDGTQTKVKEMNTPYLFNCFRLYYNHLALHYNQPTVWMTKLSEPLQLLVIDDPEYCLAVCDMFGQVLSSRDNIGINLRGYERIIRYLERVRLCVEQEVKRGNQQVQSSSGGENS